ncbi:4Fe-4S dicluster domain-containing protein [Gordonia jinghuaiqii]|uniref:ferredoxin--NADP(+) reductase n=1 Tax=Gordonia jinghuaiqii TaxID=2758710 RepID=A0A7D7LVT9_9ACTN|nr:FAD-dependent oxidoreductase [Gordonia jinghuaiqii]MCR5978513.1 4Fe-4S dicluster domain-containing protein [Gordonia jinghuaiqii]QMT02841.1 FAD-dependent oxidoreductase [Gordonia jinghuaiqii]
MFVITQSCCSDAACVSVCPVNCIHPTPEERGFGSSDILHIDPEACIDCGACADACPVDAIYPADKLGTRDKVFIDINADFYKHNPDVRSGWEPIDSESGSTVTYPEVPKLPAGLRVALVGTGPSGGYALRTLLDRTEAQVTVIDKLPTPGGLVRAGVAPDHPGTKGVLRGFDLLYRDPRVTMLTNVTVGDGPDQITPAELSDHFDAVFYAVGASESRRLDIPGEELPGSTSATDLVAWYNGVPGVEQGPPLRRGTTEDPATGRAVVVGTGNVALDVARILVSPPELLATTDIADRALNILREQNVHEVVLLGRRDQAAAAYTAAEYRALSEIPGVEVEVIDGVDGVDIPSSFRGPADPARRRIVFLFHSTPEEIVGDGQVESITVRTGEGRHHIATDLVVRSIGYRSTPIPGVAFDDDRGIFRNVDGRLTDDSGQIVPGGYVLGWAKRGPSGGIGVNKVCATRTVEDFIDDARSGVLRRTRRAPDAFSSLVRKRVRTVIGYRGMRAIDRTERRRGEEQGRPRVKFTQVAEMVGAAGWRRS